MAARREKAAILKSGEDPVFADLATRFAFRCLFKWKVSTLLTGSTLVSTTVTKQRSLTRVESFSRVNAHGKLNEKVLPVAVNQSGLETNLELCKEAPICYLRQDMTYCIQ